MMTIATTVTKQSSPVASRKKYPAPQRPSIEELKKKYEANTTNANQQTSMTPKQSSPKMLKKSKVKQMASMFNSKISQIIRREPDVGKYTTLVNELTPEPKPQPKTGLPKPLPLPKIRYNKERAPLPSPRTKAKAKAQQKSMYFVSEDNFAKLTVKDKAQLYTQFIDDMSKKNPKFGKHAELMEANVKKVVARGEVINEKQASVKRLLEELEARCAFPKQTVSPLALQRINSMRKSKANAKGPVKSKEFEDILQKKVSHITTLTVTLQPIPEMKKQRRARSLPRRRRDHEQVLKELGIIEPSHKRNNDEMRSSLPIEAYAPPKKIRRTRTERLTPQIVFQNQQLENLFFTWLRERQDKEKEEIVKECETTEVKSKSSIDKLLEEAIAKLETVETKQKDEKEIETKANEITPKLTPRKKKPAPPVPTHAKQIPLASCEASTTSSVKHSEAEESESGLGALTKINSEDSQPDTQDKETEQLEKESDFGKPIKPLRKKKMRRTLTWKKDTSIEETHPITSTDSDSDSKISETINKNKMLFIAPQMAQVTEAVETPIEPSFVELDESLMREVNSPRKIKSAYTLTACSPIPCQQEEDLKDFNKVLDASECVKNETCHSWPSLVDNEIEQDFSLQNKTQSSDLSMALPNLEPRSLADSFIDQGFETGSNDMDSPIRAPKKSALKRTDIKVSGPLFIKLGSDGENKAETPSGFSTPIKGHLQQQQAEKSTSGPAPQQLFSPIAMSLKNRRKSLYDTESRRNSLAMQVIREDHPLEHHEMTSPRNLNNTEQTFFANAPTLDMCNDMTGLNTDKTSQFWIKCGDFSVSLDIYYNDAERVRLLYEIFSQRSCDTKDLHFGIDDHKFSVHNPQDQENISKRLPANKDCSHYWFSTGDLAIPFGGKRLSAEKIQRLFEFIKASVEETGILRFGVDTVEFSNVPEFWNQSPKYSMESSYSMLVGLQSGNSNGLEGRSKFAWPNSKPVRVSDLDQSDYECEDFEDNDSCRLSFSPFGSNHFDLAALGNEELSLPRNSEAMMNSESFGYEYENESLDHLFGDKYNAKPMPVPQIEATPVPEMLNTLKSQQERLSLVQTKLSTYNNPANLSSDALDALKGTPEYIAKLRSIVAEITSKGSSSGFKDCTVQELESYMFFLSRYADICLHSCSDHMEKVLDALLDQRAVVV
ncbi:uncharacterized protein LOC119609381 [Lucilia sericata]|uniref:uncharacterized protein LOC119609381 n=1 Tax=Lucilia sericata TaxID=13632 RepID=UPI0018A7E945|nr:uncharacterized protein LOC119609381 [Lucilia sericata]